MGRVAVVTGAGRGIGRAAALALAARGAHVLGVSRTEAELASLGLTYMVESVATGGRCARIMRRRDAGSGPLRCSC